MTKTNLVWHVMPKDQGQIVTVAWMALGGTRGRVLLLRLPGEMEAA